MGSTVTSVTVGITQSPEQDRRQRFFVHLRQDGGDPSQLLDLLATVVEREDWKRLESEDGVELDFYRYITEPFPVGIGWSLEDVQTILKLHHKYERPPRLDRKKAKQMAKLRDTVERLLTKPQRTNSEARQGNQNARKSENETDNISLVSDEKTGYGTSASYLKSRLARDAPEILERKRQGEFKSYRAAAIAAGIVKPDTGLDLLKKAWRKADADERAHFLEWTQALE